MPLNPMLRLDLRLKNLISPKQVFWLPAVWIRLASQPEPLVCRHGARGGGGDALRTALGCKGPFGKLCVGRRFLRFSLHDNWHVDAWSKHLNAFVELGTHLKRCVECEQTELQRMLQSESFPGIQCGLLVPHRLLLALSACGGHGGGGQDKSKLLAESLCNRTK